MLPRLLVVGSALIILFILLTGFLQHKDEFLANILPKGNTPLQGLGAPSCPEPLVLQTPVDLTKATSVLYPGQVRGGDFKPHGGFRFDGVANNSVEVRAPMEASFTDASRYIEQGEVQYMLDFQNDCGIRYRFDHIQTLTPKFEAVIAKLPEAKVDNSRTTHINENITVSAGELIATKVGFKKNSNVTVDFGVYDMRGKIFTTPQDNAVCWFDWLPKDDAAKVRALPAGDGKSGKQSTLCK